MRLSKFGQRLADGTGTRSLMDDLGLVLNSGVEVINLGGGNPSVIPTMMQRFDNILKKLADTGELGALASCYADPRGHLPFLEALADLLNGHYGWSLSAKHIMTTTGSQASFFMLFNALAGDDPQGLARHILMPASPEYIGYNDLGMSSSILRSQAARIELLDARTFKYHVDFDALTIDENTAAICVSRPTNPTGNVISDTELANLRRLACEADIPLIIDGAYGLPFPNILFEPATMFWDEGVVLCMSLSKLGLPGLRTGIVIASEALIDVLVTLNAGLTLANCSVGAAVATHLLANGEVLTLARDVVRPYYEDLAQRALRSCHEAFHDLDFRVHQPGGAIFLWLWFPGLPITTLELYERLKARGVLVIPGPYFGPGLQAPWPHLNECLRLSYAQAGPRLNQGLMIIAEEVRNV